MDEILGTSAIDMIVSAVEEAAVETEVDVLVETSAKDTDLALKAEAKEEITVNHNINKHKQKW